MKNIFNKNHFLLVLYLLASIALTRANEIEARTDTRVENVDKLREAAATAMQEENWREAEEYLRKLVIEDKKDNKHFRRLGQVLLNQEKNIEAETYLAKAIDSGDGEALSLLGIAKLRLGKIDWVKNNKDQLFESLIGGDIYCLLVLAALSVKEENPIIFQSAMIHVKDAELAKHPDISSAVLTAYRAHMDRMIEEAGQGRK